MHTPLIHVCTDSGELEEVVLRWSLRAENNPSARTFANSPLKMADRQICVAPILAPIGPSFSGLCEVQGNMGKVS